MDARDRATVLLNRLGAGDAGVADELMQLVYAELHALARAQMGREAHDHTLQATALVHEAFLRLVQQPDQLGFESRRQFYRLASKVMRSLLVDHARRKKAAKRGGDRVRVALDEAAASGAGAERDVDLLDLDEALAGLGEVDEELARLVELRYFGGLTVPQVAETLGLPQRTTERKLGVAAAWLRERLDG
jgi:RNA polymerase sigma factor (TIGR02999 family)